MEKKYFKIKKSEKSIAKSTKAIEPAQDIIVKKPTKIVGQPILATGKRKTAIAQVKLFMPGSGKILINNKNLEQYFPYFEWQKIVKSPLEITGQAEKCDLIIKLNGGGLRSQAEAARLGISRALVQFNINFRKILKLSGLLTRDARIKERKKPGLKRARRAPQWQKR